MGRITICKKRFSFYSKYICNVICLIHNSAHCVVRLPTLSYTKGKGCAADAGPVPDYAQKRERSRKTVGFLRGSMFAHEILSGYMLHKMLVKSGFVFLLFIITFNLYGTIRMGSNENLRNWLRKLGHRHCYFAIG